jgi:DNA invertase Pin-like site-specific DNA recombinase
MRQVIENIESTKRQYALRGRAIALGWRDDQIIVIDNDQGESGASAAWREGFQRLVTDVGMGHAGIVMGLEVSRLARNNADWHRLLEICALTDTLILDEDGVYDPASFNDRLLLGLKGTMSEAELHVLKARVRGGILNKVRRGEYRCPLPTGFVYDQAGNVVLDPDAQIRETTAYFFETFSRVGSACQMVKVFRKEGLLCPSRLRVGDTIVFRPLTTWTALRMLTVTMTIFAVVPGRNSGAAFSRPILQMKWRSQGGPVVPPMFLILPVNSLPGRATTVIVAGCPSLRWPRSSSPMRALTSQLFRSGIWATAMPGRAVSPT